MYFSTSYYSLIDRGFVFGIAQIRGGSDLGEQWYENGKLLKKKNTFTDFIACSEMLINEKYTSPDKLADSILEYGAEVQKGNPPVERNIQRLFRRKEAATLIKRCNDFGAGGVFSRYR